MANSVVAIDRRIRSGRTVSSADWLGSLTERADISDESERLRELMARLEDERRGIRQDQQARPTARQAPITQNWSATSANLSKSQRPAR